MKSKIVKSRFFSLGILGLGMWMVYQGYQNGEAQVVLDKAVRICMECIGIG